MSLTFLWYIPNTVEPGHRGDETVEGYGTLDYSTDLARTAEEHGWSGALIGTGWGRPDTFTVATAITARTTTFRPLVAIRPGYWQPAHFASAAATLDRLSGGRLLVNIVSGKDNLAAYGDVEGDQARRYARTKEFMRLVRRLWTEERVTHVGDYFHVTCSTVAPGPYTETGPRLYFGGASAAKVAAMAQHAGTPADGQLTNGRRRGPAVGQQRLLDLAERGDVLDTCLYTAPGRYGGGGAGTTWLVGSPDDVTAALHRYAELGIGHFVLSDTPYKRETARVGDALIGRLRESVQRQPVPAAAGR
jgi:alkanesulfonate monooxygenase